MRCERCSREIPEIPGAKFCPLCGAALPVLADPWISRVIAGRYTIVSLLGEGGISRVYAAEQTIGQSRRRVAVKLLLPQHASDVTMVARFSRECELVALLKHPNIVRIHDFGEAEPGVFFIAMELVPGESLGAVLRREGALSPERALRVLTQAGRALAAAHDAGIVHRDVKPDNLMLTAFPDESDVVTVLDFGIAKSFGGPARPASTVVTQIGAVLGTPPYMSPEQFLGESVDARADIYSLGVVAFETLTGTLPFVGGDASEWGSAHLTLPPRSFDATPHGSAVPGPMRGAVLHALSKKRQDRPSSMREFLRELGVAELPSRAPSSLRQGQGASASGTVAGTIPPDPLAVRQAGVPRTAGPFDLGTLSDEPSRTTKPFWFSALIVFSVAFVAIVGSVGVTLIVVGSRTASAPSNPVIEMPEAGIVDSGPIESSVSAPVVSEKPDARAAEAACRRVLQSTTCAQARAAIASCPQDTNGYSRALAEVVHHCGAHGHEEHRGSPAGTGDADVPPMR